MSHIRRARVLDTATGSGTASVTLSGTAPAGYRAFGSVMAVGDTCFATIVDRTTNAWEESLCTLQAGNVLQRTSVIDGSSGAGVAVSFAAGTKDVFQGVPPSKTVTEDNAGNAKITGVLTGSANDYQKAQDTFSGGGTITWAGNNGKLKWTVRFLCIPINYTTAPSGYIDITQPITNIPAANVYDGAARTADANGVVLKNWEALWAVHTPGGLAAAVSFYITSFTATFNAPSNWILVAAINGDDGSALLGNGQSVPANGTIYSGFTFVLLQPSAPGTQQVGNINVNGRISTNTIIAGQVAAPDVTPGTNYIQAPGGIWSVAPSGVQGAVGTYDKTAGGSGIYLYSGIGGQAGIAVSDNAGAYKAGSMTFGLNGDAGFYHQAILNFPSSGGGALIFNDSVSGGQAWQLGPGAGTGSAAEWALYNQGTTKQVLRVGNNGDVIAPASLTTPYLLVKGTGPSQSGLIEVRNSDNSRTGYFGWHATALGITSDNGIPIAANSGDNITLNAAPGRAIINQVSGTNVSYTSSAGHFPFTDNTVSLGDDAHRWGGVYSSFYRATGPIGTGYSFKDLSGGTDSKQWDFFADKGGFTIRALNDAYTAANAIMSVARGSGYTINEINWYVGANTLAMKINANAVTPGANYSPNLGWDTARWGTGFLGYLNCDLQAQGVFTGGDVYVGAFYANSTAGVGTVVNNYSTAAGANSRYMLGLPNKPAGTYSMYHLDVSGGGANAGISNGPAVGRFFIDCNGTVLNYTGAYFYPTTDQSINLGGSGNRWGVVYTTNVNGGADQLTLSGGSKAVGVNGSAFYPQADDYLHLGWSTIRWSVVWAVNGTVQTSDISLKTEIAALPDVAFLFDEIEPITFRWKNGKRTHWGFKGGQVRDAFAKTGRDFGGYVRGEDGKDNLRPDQMIPVLWKRVQELTEELRELRSKIEGRA